VKARVRRAAILFLDEAFRLAGGDPMSPLGKLDVILRTLRRCDTVFGGLRMFISGDPIQLMSAGKDAVGDHVTRTLQYQVSDSQDATAT